MCTPVRRHGIIDANSAAMKGSVMDSYIQKVANVVIVHVDGRVDHSTAPAFGSMLLPHVEGCSKEEKKILVDLSKVNYMSSAGLRVLMIAAKGCRKQDGAIVLSGLQPSVREVFNIGRFDMVLDTYTTVRDALAAISPPAAVIYDER
jgi:anti-anti-sigma factor